MPQTLRSLRIFGLLATIACLPAVWASGQTTPPGSIRGKVVQQDGNPLNSAVLVRLENIRGTKTTAFTDNLGQFDFLNVMPGIYYVVVDGDNHQDGGNLTVEVFPNSPSIVTLMVRLRTPEPAKKATSISAGELSQKVPPAAQKEFDRASAASKEGKIELSITHYRKAIAIYPTFLMARNDLGAQLMTLGKLDEAAEELRAAIAIEPKAFNPRLNLGMVLVKQHNFAEGADELRRALSSDSTSASAHFYLGLALVGTEDSINAEKEFKTAYNIGGAKYALALFHLGELYFNRGERQAALNAFQQYLKESPDASNAAHVRQMIAMLK
jgi:Tfp pilus assembly protein PilF